MSADLVRAVLRAYADLSTAPAGSDALVVARPEDIVSLGTSMAVDPRSMHSVLGRQVVQPATWPALERLAKLDALHSDEQLLRQGWVTLVGTLTINGERVRVRQPIVSRPVSIRHRSTVGRVATSLIDLGSPDDLLVSVLGEFELTPLVSDAARRALLMINMEFGRGGLHGGAATEKFLRRFPALTSWIRAVAEEVGEPRVRTLPYTTRVDDWIDRSGLVAIVEHTLYLTREVNTLSQRNTLLGWASRDGLDRTAFHTLFAAADAGPAKPGRQTVELPDVGTAASVESPVALSPSQRAVVLRSRSEPLTVVSGAPGSGKTHTVCAIALDAVGQGRSVLIATQSRYAADVVTELLQRTPGPDPVRFGNAAGMSGLIDELSDRQTHPISGDDVHRLDIELEMARARVEGLRTSIASDLQLEADAASAAQWQDALPALILAAPRLFDVESDLDSAADLLRDALAAEHGTGGDRGFFARRRRRRRRRRLDAVAGSTDRTELARIELALDAARAGRASATLAASGGIRIGDRWSDLDRAEQQLRLAVGRRLRVRPIEAGALDERARVALGRLIAALRAGRGRRRELLSEIDPGALTAPAPLWIGTLSEIEDVLPATAGLFDLVVLDEASQIEQSRAAPALLRARRAVVVGDPHQLRHVSFQSEGVVDAALDRHDLQRWRSLLDTRRVSSFDLAAATTPVDQLRDHFRSVPHLIEFSVRHFYRDRVDIMTRHPRNESFDAIDLVSTVSAGDVGKGVHRDEVDAVVSMLRAMRSEGARSIGVISPFRDQADALESALVAEFTSREIDEMSLRVGTVHEFQGGERDTVIASLAIGELAKPGRRRFLESPNLFNVMITRARSRMIVVTSLPLDDTGLTGDYLRYGQQALPPVSDDVAPDGWTGALATELRRNGVSLRSSYPVGPWELDLCVGDGEDCRYLECSVDPEGPGAHIDRHLALMRLGWTIIDAYPSMWDGDAVRAALQLREHC